jgi:hypothetical protein
MNPTPCSSVSIRGVAPSALVYRAVNSSLYQDSEAPELEVALHLVYPHVAEYPCPLSRPFISFAFLLVGVFCLCVQLVVVDKAVISCGVGGSTLSSLRT